MNLTIVPRITKFVFIVLPIGATFCATVFGFILSITEDWSFDDCFWIMMGEITQLQIEMTSKDYTITRLPGKIAASFCGIWCLGFLAVIIGISGNLLIAPIIHPSKIDRHTSMLQDQADDKSLSPKTFKDLEHLYDTL